MNTRASNSYEFLKGGGEEHSRQTKENVVDWILSGDALGKINIKGSIAALLGREALLCNIPAVARISN